MAASASRDALVPALDKLRFNNRALSALPIDMERKNFTRQVAGACFSLVAPTPLQKPAIVAVSTEALEQLGISPAVAAEDPQKFAEYFCGNRLFVGGEPAAHCYCGHQFGSFAGQLGDGAAIYLGEVVDAAGRPRGELQLKGAGPTPYSRSADGRKVLRSSIREFLASEAMDALGVPTTRAASIITSDTTVERDPLYSGRVVQERCSVVARSAPTFIRFGSFEICKPEDDESDRAGPSAEHPEILETLFDFTAATYFPELLARARAGETADGGGATVAPLTPAVRAQATELVFTEVVQRTAALVARWQCVGFCHGVLNTDNMSITGLTIDYGPYAFMTYYDENMVPNYSDTDGRYSFRQQPAVCKWNLHRLADAFGVMSPEREAALHAIVDEKYDAMYAEARRALLAAKFGIPERIAAAAPSAIDTLDAAMFATLQETSADMTDAFRALSRVPAAASSPEPEVLAAIEAVANDIADVCAPPAYTATVCQRQLARGRPQIHPSQIDQLLRLADESPGTLSQMFGGAPVGALTSQLQREKEKWERLKADQARLASLRSADADAKHGADVALWRKFLLQYSQALHELGIGDQEQERQERMKNANPIFILRPWILRDVIEGAERGPAGYDTVQQLLDRCRHPFEEDERDGDLWMMRAPVDASSICVSCSS